MEPAAATAETSLAKARRDPQPFVYPLPVALVTCLERDGGPNILTVSWITNVCAQPPMVAISLRPHRYSTEIIQDTGEFGVSIPSYDIAYEVDLCGTLSGRDTEKVRVSGLTEEPGEKIRAPLIAECPVSMECVTRHTVPLGSHILFVGEVVALRAEEDLYLGLDLEGEEEPHLEITRAKPLLYAPHSHDYWILGDIAQSYHASGGKKP